MPGWKHAFSLPSEAVKAARPPGTVLLIEHSVTHQDGRHVDRVVRFPMPTADPADPLNWPKWQKVSCMVTVSLYAFVSNYISASIAPALPTWNHEFPHDRRPMKDLMQFVALNVLVLGLGNIFWVPLSNIFGRRLILVLSTLLLFSATSCGIPFTGFTPTLVIRIFQGLGSSASETVVPAVVGDLFFVHERGSWMAFYTASLASGSVIGGITGGYIATQLGWVSQFWVGTGLTGLTFLATIFFVPESIFDRPKPTLPVQRSLPRVSRPRQRIRSSAPKLSLTTLPSMRFTLPSRFRWQPPPDNEVALTWYDSSSSVDDNESSAPPASSRCYNMTTNSTYLSIGATDEYSNTARLNNTSIYGHLIDLSRPRPNPSPYYTRQSHDNCINQHDDDSSRYRPYTYLRSLALSRYRGQVARQFLKPWSTLRLPATWIIMLQYGGLVGGVAVISTVGPQVLTRPPKEHGYGWGRQHGGLLFAGAFVGIVLGGLCTGLTADRRAARHARGDDRGFAEPEARVTLMLPALLIGTCGLAVFGACAQYPTRAGWVGLEFAFGMVSFALAQVPSIWFGYLIDAYDQLASDCFVMICILRGAIPFAWTFFVEQWIQRDGFLTPFGGFTAIMGTFSLLVIPILCGGKRMRIATARYVVRNQ